MIQSVLLAALLPIVICLWLIFRQDKAKPEPKSKLVKGVFFGVLSVFVSFMMSIPFGAIGLYDESATTASGQVMVAFFSAAIPEEVAKMLMLWLLLRKNKYFDEYIDGVVYAACIGMGFAAFENIMYLFDNINDFIGVGIARGLLSVPGHLFFAILMGYFYSLASFSRNVGKRKIYKFWALMAPILAHGIYDALLMVSDVQEGVRAILFLVLIVLMIGLFVGCKRRIKNLVAFDAQEAYRQKEEERLHQEYLAAEEARRVAWEAEARRKAEEAAEETQEEPEG